MKCHAPESYLWLQKNIDTVDALKKVRCTPEGHNVLQILISTGESIWQQGLKTKQTAQLMDTLGWGLYQIGETDQASEWFEKALKIAGPDNVPGIKQHLDRARQPKFPPDLIVEPQFHANHKGHFLEAGEAAELKLKVENRGKGAAFGVTMSVKQDNKHVFFKAAPSNTITP